MDLYQAKAKGKQICVKSASIAAACPATTALRWIQALEEMKLIVRKEDISDRRRAMIELTDTGVVKIRTALRLHL